MSQLILAKFQVCKLQSHLRINSSNSAVVLIGLHQETENLLPIYARFPENAAKIW